MKVRGTAVTQVQRSALIMVDGRKTELEILAAMSGIGLTAADIQKLVELGYIEPVDGNAAVSSPLAPASARPKPLAAGYSVASTGADTQPLAVRTDQELYQSAYPIATKLTSGLGLRGFRLNLAVESVGNYADLVKLAPKIQEAVGDAKYAELKAALRI